MCTPNKIESYYNFFSTLLKIEPKLVDIIAIGTDGLKAVLPVKLIHLRCFIHMKDDIRRKLTEFLLPENVREGITKDLFGTQQGSTYIKGILDATSSGDFDDCLLSMQTKWDEISPQGSPGLQLDFEK